MYWHEQQMTARHSNFSREADREAHGTARIVLLPTPCHMPPREKARHSKSSSRSSSRHPAPQPSVLALEDAETLQQRAERKRGREAVSAYEQAASKFRRALDLEQRSPLPFERHCDAYFGLAEVLQNWAEAVLAVCRTLPDADLTRDVEQQASNAAQPLFRQSVEAYQQVRTGMQEMRADAAVNSGNTLAAWAELLPAGEAVQMLASAQKAYEAALAQEEDAATWGNRADALVRQAELLAEVTPAQVGDDAVNQAYTQAMQAYEKACSMTSSEQGDDLPGLLHNWGVGLRSMADLQKDAEAACNMYALAVQKLQASIQFVRGDVAPHNAVGDAHVSWAEHLPDSDAMQHLHLALDQGYQGALHISASCSEALLGIGEVHSKMGKLCLRNMSNNAELHFQESAKAYKRALQFPETLGSFQDRGEARYNYACVLCLCKRYDEGISVLTELQRRQVVNVHDLTSDPDFADIRDTPPFQHLIEQAAVRSTGL